MSNRLLLLTFCLLLLPVPCLGISRQGSPVTLKPDVYSLEQLSELTSKATGIPVTVDRNLLSLTVFVRCDQQPCAMLWEKIARVADIKVDTSHSRIRVFRDTEALQRLNRSESEWRARALNIYLMSLRKDVASAPPAGMVAARTAASLQALIANPIALYRTIKSGGITASIGASQLLKELVSNMSAEMLLRSYSSPQFFSTDDESGRFKYSTTQNKSIKRYVEYVSELRKQVSIPEEIPQWERDVIYEFLGAAAYDEEDLRIVLTVLANGRRLLANVSCYGPSGKKLDGALQIIDPDSIDLDASPNSEIRTASETASKSVELPMAISLLASDYISPEQWIEHGSKIRNIGERFTEHKEEPLKVFLSTVFVASFKDIQKNVLMLVPDKWMGIWSSCIQGTKFNQQAFLQQIAADVKTVTDNDGWLVLGMHNLARYHFEQFDRLAMREYLTKVRDTEYVAFDDYALLAWQNNAISFSSKIAKIIKTLTEAHTGHRIQFTGTYELLSLAGSVVDRNARETRSPIAMDFRQDNVQRLLRRAFAYGVEKPSAKSEYERSGYRVIGVESVQSAYLTTKDREEAVLQRVSTTESGVGYPYYAESVESISLLVRQLLQSNAGTTAEEILEGFLKQGRRTNCDFSVVINDKYAASMTWVGQALFERGDRGLKYQDLPDNIKNRISSPPPLELTRENTSRSCPTAHSNVLKQVPQRLRMQTLRCEH